MSGSRETASAEIGTLKLGDVLAEFDERLGSQPEPEILTLTEKMGFVSQRERFNKRLAIADTSNYKVIGLNDIAFNPYLLWANAIAQNTSWKKAIISPLYPTFRVRKGYSERFVNYLLCSGYLRLHYGAISYGSVPRKRRVTVSDFLNLPIPRQPSFAEQERIVSLLDEADELRKLRVQAGRRTTDLIPALFHEMFGDPAVNPRRWKLTGISEMAEVQGGLQLTPLRHTYPLRRPYLRVANVQRGFLVLDEIKEIGLLDSEYERVRLTKGDLLLVEGNGNPREVGRAAIWDGSVEHCVHQNHLIRVRPHDDMVTSEYLLGFVNSESGRRYFHGSGNTTSGLVTISTSIVKNCRIPVPPPPLQKDFAKRVAEIRRLEAEQAASRRRSDDLFHSLLHRAFQGDI